MPFLFRATPQREPGADHFARKPPPAGTVHSRDQPRALQTLRIQRAPCIKTTIRALCAHIAEGAGSGEMPPFSISRPGHGLERWMNRWKPALNAFAITFEGRLFPTDD